MRLISRVCRSCIAAGLLMTGGSFAHAQAPDQHSPQTPTVRQWSDSSGRFHADGTLVSGNRTEVRLRKVTGSVITVAFAHLSAADQRFVIAALEEGSVSTQQPVAITAEPITAGLTYLAKKPVVSDALAAVRDSTLSIQSTATVPENMVYVRLSKAFLQRLVARDVSRQRQVNDSILGSTVTGVSQTNGSTEVVLHPDSQCGQLEIHFSGATNYQTVADAGPIQVFVNGVTQFASAKAVRLDEQGIEIGPAATNTLTSSTITGIQTSLPGLRGKIALRIGSERAAERQPRAREITGQHTKRQLDEGFDETTSQDIAKVWKALCSKIAALPPDDPLRPHGWQASTTSDALQIVFLSRRGGERVPAPAETDDRSDIVVQINAAVVSRGLTDVDFHKLLQPAAAHLVAMPGATPPGGTTMHWSDDHRWLSVCWSKTEQPAEPQTHAASVAGQPLPSGPKGEQLVDGLPR
jgi:SLA1 homology domain 1, SHD1